MTSPQNNPFLRCSALVRPKPRFMLFMQVTQIPLLPLLPVLLVLLGVFTRHSESLFFPRGGSFGYLAAVATSLDLVNRDAYVAFNFEANYGLPSNDSYHEWIDRWDLDEHYLGIGNNVTAINGRRAKRRLPLHTRNSFYRSVSGYLEYFGMNATACLLRTICEVSETNLDEHNGLVGSLFKILFLPTTSAPERDAVSLEMYEAEEAGRSERSCVQYTEWCPKGPLDLISAWL